MKKFTIIVSLFFIVFTASACGQYTTVRQHSQFTANPNKSYTVSVLPPNVVINSQGVREEGDRLPEKESAKREEFIALSAEVLEKKGYRITERNSHVIQARYAGMEADFDNFKNMYNKELMTLYSPANQRLEKEKAFAVESSLKEAIAPFADKSNADLLLYINYIGKDYSVGHQATNLAIKIFVAALVGPQPSTFEGLPPAIMSAALIDAKKGTLLWVNNPSNEPSIKELFKNIPDKEEAVTAKVTKDTTADGKV